jgi:hypothetical protein
MIRQSKTIVKICPIFYTKKNYKRCFYKHGYCECFEKKFPYVDNPDVTFPDVDKEIIRPVVYWC